MTRSPIQQQRRVGSGVVLRHRAAVAACACLTVDAAAVYCTPGAQPRSGKQMVVCITTVPVEGVLRKFFLYCTAIFSEKTFSYHMYYHSFLQCRRRLRLEIRKEHIIFESAAV